MVSITGQYSGELHCQATHGPSGSALQTDAPKDNQGRGEAFSPTDLVATALATCAVTTLAIAARRQGVELGPVPYEVTKEMTDAPRTIGRLTLRLKLPAEARKLPEGFVRTTIENCPVSRSLATTVQKVFVLGWA
ncbi:MAG: OsmC family protein [Opitutaceae bacterium]